MTKKMFVNMVLVLALLLPPGLSVVSAAPLKQEEMTYTVKLGDNLWTLAEKYLGKGAAYWAIVGATNAKYVEDPSFATIANPSLIHPGWKLLIPSAEEAAGYIDVPTQVPPTATMSRDEAVEILIREVIEPDSNRDVLVAYGPQSMLHDGDEVEPFETDVEPFPGILVRVSGDKWFFWIDDEPDARFVHPTRFVFIDANRWDATIGDGIEITQQGWWPEIHGQSYYGSDLERLTSLDIVFGTPPARPLPSSESDQFQHSSVRRAPGLAVLNLPGDYQPGSLLLPYVPQANRCAILVAGTSDADMMGDVRDMTASLYSSTSSADLLWSNILTATSVTRIDVSRLIGRANSSSCQAVYFHISAHGGIDSIVLADGNVSANDFARLLAPLSARYVYAVIDSCYSGSLTDEILAQVQGIVTTSADDSHTCKSWWYIDGSDGNGYFTEDLSSAWTNASVDAGDADTQVSLPEAFDYVRRSGHAKTRAASPTIEPRYMIRAWSWWVDRQWPAPNYFEYDYEVTNVLPRDVTAFKVCFASGTSAEDIVKTEGSEWEYRGGALHTEGTGVMTIPDGWAWSFPSSNPNCIVFNTSGSFYQPIAVGETRVFKFMSAKGPGYANGTVGRWDGSTHAEDPQIDIIAPTP